MITIISGTNRKGSNTKKVAKTYQNLLKSKGLESQVLDLSKLPTDFIQNMYGTHTAEVQEIIKTYITDVSSFAFVIPEYNGTYTGMVKLFMDGVSPSHFNNKNAILIGVASGRAGNIIGLDQFTTVLNHLKVEVLSNKVLLSQVDGLIGENNELNEENCLKTIEDQLELMIKVFNLK